jgi:DNA-directed RNA polymerase beta' subunit
MKVDKKRALKRSEIDQFISSLQVPFGRTPISEEIHDEKMTQLKSYLTSVLIYPSMIPKLFEQLRLRYYKSIVPANNTVGILASQTAGEQSTQTTLNTHRQAGIGNSFVNQGVSGMISIFAASVNQRKSTVHIYLNPDKVGDLTKVENALNVIRHQMKPISCQNLCTSIRPVVYEKSEWWYRHEYNKSDTEHFIKFIFDVNLLHYYKITLAEIAETLAYESGIWVEYSPMVLGEIHVYVCDVSFPTETETTAFYQRPGISEKIVYYYIRDDLITRLKQITLRGVDGIDDLDVARVDGSDEWMIYSLNGPLKKILTLDYIDPYKTYSNNIMEIYETLGIEAAKEAIIRELTSIMGSEVDKAHIHLIANSMCFTGSVLSVSRYGLKNRGIETLTEASFEEIISAYLTSALLERADPLQGVSSCVAVGQEIHNGTGAVKLISTDSRVEILEFS